MRNKVLLVDHDANFRRILRSVLNYNGYQIVTAESGESGIQKANHDSPDFILLELDLPDVGGLEIIARLKGNAMTQNIPVTLCTDRADAGVRSEALHRGAASILTKPVSSAELLKVVRAYVSTTPPRHVAIADEPGGRTSFVKRRTPFEE